MTADEIKKMKERIYDGLDMVMEKSEKIGREKVDGYTIDELYKMADIVKDCAKTLKDLAKAHKIFSENGVDRY